MDSIQKPSSAPHTGFEIEVGMHNSSVKIQIIKPLPKVLHDKEKSAQYINNLKMIENMTIDKADIPDDKLKYLAPFLEDSLCKIVCSSQEDIMAILGSGKKNTVKLLEAAMAV